MAERTGQNRCMAGSPSPAAFKEHTSHHRENPGCSKRLDPKGFKLALTTLQRVMHTKIMQK